MDRSELAASARPGWVGDRRLATAPGRCGEERGHERGGFRPSSHPMCAAASGGAEWWPWVAGRKPRTHTDTVQGPQPST